MCLSFTNYFQKIVSFQTLDAATKAIGDIIEDGNGTLWQQTVLHTHTSPVHVVDDTILHELSGRYDLTTSLATPGGIKIPEAVKTVALRDEVKLSSRPLFEVIRCAWNEEEKKLSDGVCRSGVEGPSSSPDATRSNDVEWHEFAIFLAKSASTMLFEFEMLRHTIVKKVDGILGETLHAGQESGSSVEYVGQNKTSCTGFTIQATRVKRSHHENNQMSSVVQLSVVEVPPTNSLDGEAGPERTLTPKHGMPSTARTAHEPTGHESILEELITGKLAVMKTDTESVLAEANTFRGEIQERMTELEESQTQRNEALDRRVASIQTRFDNHLARFHTRFPERDANAATDDPLHPQNIRTTAFWGKSIEAQNSPEWIKILVTNKKALLLAVALLELTSTVLAGVNFLGGLLAIVLNEPKLPFVQALISTVLVGVSQLVLYTIYGGNCPVSPKAIFLLSYGLLAVCLGLSIAVLVGYFRYIDLIAYSLGIETEKPSMLQYAPLEEALLETPQTQVVVTGSVGIATMIFALVVPWIIIGCCWWYSRRRRAHSRERRRGAGGIELPLTHSSDLGSASLQSADEMV